MVSVKKEWLRKTVKAVTKVVPHELGYANILWTVMLLAFVVLYQMKDGVHPFPLNGRNLLVIVASIFSVNLLWQLVSLLTNRSLRMRRVLFFVFAALYWLLASYHHRSKCSLDFAVAADNTGEAFTIEALGTIVDAVGIVFLIVLPVFIALLVFVERKTGVFTKTVHKKYLSAKIFFVALLYMGLTVSGWSTRDEMLYFMQTGYQYHTEASQYVVEYQSGTFPYAKKFVYSAASKGRSERPNVFFIMMESFNAHFVESKTPQGKEYTPFFNKLIKQGLYIEKFYGNSIQTCKGQFAALFSVYPSIRGKVFKRYGHVRFRSLADIFKNNGYDTLFFQCYKKLSYDKTGSFMKKHGFSDVRTVFDFIKKEDKPYVWGWGVQDGVFYKRFFDYMDQLHKQKKRQGPMFATLATTVNHLPFDKVPVKSRFVHPIPRSVRHNYANSIRLCDMGLADFFKELKKRAYLKDSVVIITGDHSFPIGEHGYYHNEVSFYEEFFRTPFLMVWPNKLAPRRIKKAYSHVDVAPSVVDMLRLSVPQHHFVGNSFVDPKAKSAPVYLIQPYNGRFLGVVKYPLKYVKHFRTQQEYIFNLEKDPKEENNLFSQTSKKIIANFRAALKTLYLNQKLLDNNGFLPH